MATPDPTAALDLARVGARSLRKLCGAPQSLGVGRCRPSASDNLPPAAAAARGASLRVRPRAALAVRQVRLAPRSGRARKSAPRAYGALCAPRPRDGVRLSD